MIDIQPLTQRAPCWGHRPLGTSASTIASEGCLLTCLAMIGDMPPNELNALLNHVEGFDNGNMLRWWAVPKVLPLRLETLQDCMYVPAPIDDMMKYLYKGIPIICRVDDWQGIPNDAKQHWILWINEQEYIDPRDGLTKDMVNPSRNILYWAVYTPC